MSDPNTLINECDHCGDPTDHRTKTVCELCEEKPHPRNDMSTGTPQTELIDRLFLELSQFTTAKTGREMRLEKELEELEKQEGEYVDGVESGWIAACIDLRRRLNELPEVMDGSLIYELLDKVQGRETP